MADNEQNNQQTPGQEAPLTEGTVIPDGQHPDVNEILKFDPFAPAKEVKDGAKAPAGQKDATSAKPGTAAEPPKPDAGAAKAPLAPASKTPEQLIAEHTASIRQMLERAPQTAAAPAPAAKVEAEPPKFNLGIPDVLLNAMASDDPKERSIATHALVNGIANAVWKEFDNTMRDQFNQMAQGFPRVIEAHMSARTEQQRIHNDFYGTYKQFNAPQWIPLIQAHAAQIMNEAAAAGHQVTGWTPEMRDAIAERLFIQFPTLRAAQPPGANGAQPGRKQQFATGGGGGARPPADAGPFNEMLAVLGQKPN